MRLFRYIRKHEVAMTVPVEAEIEKAAMRFHVGTSDLPKELREEGEVRVEKMPERTVVSIGARGSYHERNFSRAKGKLLDWLKKNTRYHALGPAYEVYRIMRSSAGSVRRHPSSLVLNAGLKSFRATSSAANVQRIFANQSSPLPSTTPNPSPKPPGTSPKRFSRPSPPLKVNRSRSPCSSPT